MSTTTEHKVTLDTKASGDWFNYGYNTLGTARPITVKMQIQDESEHPTIYQYSMTPGSEGFTGTQFDFTIPALAPRLRSAALPTVRGFLNSPLKYGDLQS